MTGRAWNVGVRRAAPVLLLALFALLAMEIRAAAWPTEPEVKSAFVLNFIKFVEWPASSFRSAEDPILLSVVGEDPVVESIEGLNGKTVSGRKLVVRKAADIASMKPCHVLFIGVSEKEDLSPVLSALRLRPVLTIADFEGFAGRGGVIGFIRKDDRVGFEINEEAASRAGLRVNAKLLYLGKSVRNGKGGEK